MEGYSLTDTKDGWIISTNENTAAALLIHEDFRNYFQREGYALHAAYYSKSAAMKEEVSLAYRIDRYESLQNNVDWALFGGGQWFRENPAIDPGSMRSVLLTAGLSTVVPEKRNSEGWSVFGSGEYATSKISAEISILIVMWLISGASSLWAQYDCFNIRFRAGSSAGTLPVQKKFRTRRLRHNECISVQIRYRQQNDTDECGIHFRRKNAGRYRFYGELVFPHV